MNKIAQVVAHELRATVQYTWSGQNRGFQNQTLNAGKCDVLVDVPSDWGAVLTTKPYYSSTYVFVYPRNRYASLSSFDDPVLRKLKIGLNVLGSEQGNAPPAYAIARRELAANVTGIPMFPPAKIVEAVATGEVDLSVVWGPLGGYFAKRQPIRLAVTPVSPSEDDAALRFTYSMSMVVRREDTALRDELQHVLDRRQSEIHKILQDYGVPLVSSSEGRPTLAQSTTSKKGDEERWR